MGLTACTDEEPAVGGNEPSAPSATQTVPSTTSGVPSTMKEDDKEALAGIEVKDAKKLENSTVKWLSFWDINPVNGNYDIIIIELLLSKMPCTCVHQDTHFWLGQVNFVHISKQNAKQNIAF